MQQLSISENGESKKKANENTGKFFSLHFLLMMHIPSNKLFICLCCMYSHENLFTDPNGEEKSKIPVPNTSAPSSSVKHLRDRLNALSSSNHPLLTTTTEQTVYSYKRHCSTYATKKPATISELRTKLDQIKSSSLLWQAKK